MSCAGPTQLSARPSRWQPDDAKVNGRRGLIGAFVTSLKIETIFAMTWF
jgi:hypothetical protein